ncbi:heavy metal translocating P-type ATPase [Poriferisphaera corsica]|nr:heavy metal translocating P-type ATPase [Poriferisphaera corsica]
MVFHKGMQYHSGHDRGGGVSGGGVCCGDHDHAGVAGHGGWLGENSELIYAIASGVCLVVGALLWWLTGLPEWVGLVWVLGAYYFGGWYTLKEAIESVSGGRFEIDFLMLVAAGGAAYLGEYGDGAFLLFLFSLGHALEHYAMGRAKRAIESLAELTPTFARVIRDGQEVEVGIEEIVVGDLVKVRPDERIAVDGVVVEGGSEVDQAAVTGESVPVEKVAYEVDGGERSSRVIEMIDRVGKESLVFAGTINGRGSMSVVVSKAAGDSTLSRLIRMVKEAQGKRSRTELLTAGFERVYVPCVIGFVVMLLFAWVVIDEGFDVSLYRAIAVLVGASPCALAIATPSAVLSGIARGARGGILIKGGGALEALGEVDVVAYDKTGTLTKGEPRLVDVVSCEGVSERELLSVAMGVEKESGHPLAMAVVEGANHRLDGGDGVEVEEAESVTGFGVKGVIDGEAVMVGKLGMFEEVGGEAKAEVEREVGRLSDGGRTTMVVKKGERYLGVLGVMDEAREEAKVVVAMMREMGVKRQVMLTGDHERVAEAVGQAVGVDEVMGGLLPEDKVGAVERLGTGGEVVAMVGDGVNDAPAMARSGVGIAMGAAGSDVALETAEVALMSDRLGGLPTAVGLGRKAKVIVRENLWISLGMVGILIPAAMSGLEIGPVVVLHEGSTVVVVFNALRLLGYGKGE